MFGNYDHSAGYGPLNGGAFQQWSPYAGMPGGVLGQLAAQAFVDPQMQALGLVPMGMADAQNMADRVRRMQLTKHYNKVVSGSTNADTATLGKITSGLMRAISGGELKGAEKETADQILSTINKAGAAGLPIAAAMAPDLLDRIMGPQGSSTVGSMHVALAGRYRFDPVTGRTGMSTDSATRTATQLFDSTSDIGMRGFRAGQIGSMYDEMTRRGMMPGTSNVQRTAREALQNMTAGGSVEDKLGNAYAGAGIRHGKDIKDLTNEEVQRLTGQADVQTSMRDVDTTKIKGQLKKYAGALAAMKEIFEDNGRSGVSVAELFNGLEQMTNGSLSKLDPSRVEMTVRNMHNLSNSSGIGLQGAMMMMGNASATAQQMGLDPVFAVHAVNGGMSFNQAFNATGGGANPMWGLSGGTQLAMKDVNLRLAAAKSQMSNQMALAAKYSEDGVKFKKGSAAADYIDAVKNGLPVSGMNMNESEFVAMMTRDAEGGTLSASQVSLGLQNTDALQEQVQKYNIQDTTRRVQGKEDVFPFVGEQMAFSVMASIGLSDKDGSIQKTIQDTMSATMGGLDKETRANAGLRNATIARELKAKLQNNPEVLEQTKNMTPEQERAFWEGKASDAFNAADRETRDMFGESLADQLALHDEETTAAADDARIEAAGRSIIQSSVSGIGTGDWVSNLSKALQNTDLTKDPDAIKKIAAAALGGVDNEEVKKHIGAGMENISSAQASIGDLKKQYDERIQMARYSGDAEKEKQLKAEYQTELGRQNKGLESAKKEMQDYLDTNEEARAALETAKKKSDREEAPKLGLAAGAAGAAAAADKELTKLTMDGTLRIINPDGTEQVARLEGNVSGRDSTTTGVA